MVPQTERFSLSASNDALARKCMRICRYRDDLVRDDAELAGERQGLVGFAHRPLDSRSACIGVLPEGRSPSDDVAACRDIGASLFFVAGSDRWNVWSQTREHPIHRQMLKTSEVENYFRQHQQQLAPGAIFRAKSWKRVGEGQQLDFVDADLLPMLEREAGARLRNLFERMVDTTMDSIGWKSVPNNDAEAHWLTKTNFWLLAAKLLHDKRVPRFINLDFNDVRTVFGRIAYHYNRDNPDPPKINGRLRALQEAARLAEAPPHFRNISAETLGVLYEEALISPTTRKLLGTHRTPTYLVDYMLARLGPWIEELGPKHCYIFEPACGHAPFLSGALRLISDMLPGAIADDPRERHNFLKDHLRGCDSDSFALEIARLSLTLADIPNENGWVLRNDDMFAGSLLATETASASVVLANPPFGDEQAATFLRQTVPALKPGTVFGFVLPINELTGAASADVRKRMLAECEIKEISVFPDRMFKFASVETGIVLGRKRSARSGMVTAGIRFRRIRESKMVDFRKRYDDSWRDLIDADWLVSTNKGGFVVPELRAVWEKCDAFKQLSDFAVVTKGFDFKSADDRGFPKGQITDSEERRPGFVEGYKNLQGEPETHLTPKLVWLNPDPRVIKTSRGGTEEKHPQLLQSYSPTDRDQWRHKAFIDRVGRRATSRFLIIRPKSVSIPLEVLWALLNSPLANAFTFVRTTKRDITIGVLRTLPVPDLQSESVRRIAVAAQTYLRAAARFRGDTIKGGMKARFNRKKKSRKQTAINQMQLGLPGHGSDDEIAAEKQRLRALHWRVDAEVLRLYALPPEFERELLDAFDGVPRVGVPFVQTHYIPRDFRDVFTLDEFLRITDEWEETDARRCKLIEKRITSGRRTAEEQKEFGYLQRLLMLHRRFYAPLPTADIKALAKRLKEQRELKHA